MAVAREFTPRVEAYSPTPVLLDLSGLGRLWPTPQELGRALLDAAASRAIEAQAALAFTRAAALVLARARPALTVVPAGRERAALAPAAARSPGLPEERQRILLPALGPAHDRRPRAAAARRPRRALRPRRPAPRPPRPRRGRGRPRPRAAPRAVRDDARAGLAGGRPRAAGLPPRPRARAALRHPRRARGESGLARGRSRPRGRLAHARALKPAAPSGEARTWRTLVLLDLEAHPPRDAIVRITARAEPTPARAGQFSLLDPAPALAGAARGDDGAAPRLDGRGSRRLAAARGHPPARGLRRLDLRPGPLPRGRREEPPPAPRVALRAYRPPRLAHVVLKGGTPSFVSAPGVRGAVAACAGPWRASGDWWDVAWSREEWDVFLALPPGPALAGGGLYRIFLDRLREEWFVEGELD